MAWSVDRLGRSLQDLLHFLEHLQAKKVGLYLHVQGLDTTTPAGTAMFQMLGVFAQFERAMIQERVRAGLARAKAKAKFWDVPRFLPPFALRSVRPMHVVTHTCEEPWCRGDDRPQVFDA